MKMKWKHKNAYHKGYTEKNYVAKLNNHDT